MQENHEIDGTTVVVDRATPKVHFAIHLAQCLNLEYMYYSVCPISNT